jgi:SAM-dependent methyltransferase
MEFDIIKNYWNERGKTSFLYKGEYFYTITPIPFYYTRRKLLIKLLKNIISDDIHTICDYGCGDGYYLKKLNEMIPQKKYFGMDISEEMIHKAKALNPDMEFYLASTPPPPCTI